MKKYISGVITGLLLGMSITVMAAVPGIRSAVFTDKVIIEVDGVQQAVEVISVVKEGQVDARNFVSVGDLAPALGGNVNWNGERQVVEITMREENETSIVQTQSNVTTEEWVWVANLADLVKPGYVVMANSTEVHIYEYYDNNIDNNLLLHINIENNTTSVRAKIENQRTYINKADLIKAGIITE